MTDLKLERLLDTLLEVLENPTRRKILLKLSQEDHYPLQLSKELSISQQAIMKHLKVLEDHNLVECYEERSSLGGPPRKCYAPTKQYSLRIDIGPNTFNTEVYTFDRPPKAGQKAIKDGLNEELIELKRKYAELSKKRDVHKRLAELSGLIKDLNTRIADMEAQVTQLISFKEQVRKEACSVIADNCDDYVQRRILYYLLENDDLSISVISDELGLRMKVIEDLFNSLYERGLLIDK